MTEKEEKAIEYTKQILKYPKLLADTEKEGNFLRKIDKVKIDIVVEALEQRIINQKIYAEEYEKVTKQLNCEVKDNLEKSIALEQKDKEIQELKESDKRSSEQTLMMSQRHFNDSQKIKKLKADLYECNNIISDYIDTVKEKDKIIDLMAEDIFNYKCLTYVDDRQFRACKKGIIGEYKEKARGENE